MAKHTLKTLRCKYRNTLKYVSPFLKIIDERVEVHESKSLKSNFHIHKKCFDDVNLLICFKDVQGDQKLVC